MGRLTGPVTATIASAPDALGQHARGVCDCGGSSDRLGHGEWLRARGRARSSALRTMRSIIWTASSGCWPTAVSPESMTASVPSQTAFATSEASPESGECA